MPAMTFTGTVSQAIASGTNPVVPRGIDKGVITQLRWVYGSPTLSSSTQYKAEALPKPPSLASVGFVPGANLVFPVSGDPSKPVPVGLVGGVLTQTPHLWGNIGYLSTDVVVSTLASYSPFTPTFLRASGVASMTLDIQIGSAVQSSVFGGTGLGQAIPQQSTSYSFWS